MIEIPVAIITGASDGIGAELAKIMAEGCNDKLFLVLCGRSGKKLSQVGYACQQLGAAVLEVSADLRQEAKCRELIGMCVQRFGRIDTLVTCAGILQGAFVDLADFPLETFERVIDVNVRGTFLSVKHVAPHIAKAGGGVVLCIASGAGVKGGSSSIAYGTSKAGVHGMVMVLESRLAPQNIRIHAICPGAIDTPLKRENVRDAATASGQDPDAALKAAHLASPDGVARVLAFLASADADYVRGTIFTR